VADVGPVEHFFIQFGEEVCGNVEFVSLRLVAEGGFDHRALGYEIQHPFLLLLSLELLWVLIARILLGN
jgi:hypothetical protein